MKYNFILIVIVIFIVFLLINYILNNKEYFSDKYGGGFCSINNEIGIRYSDGSCIPLSSEKSDDVDTTLKFRHYDGKPSSSSSSSSGSSSSTGSGSASTSGSASNPIVSPHSSNNDNDCVPKNSDYGLICKNRYGINYGVKDIQQCDPAQNDGVKVICGDMYFNKKNYKKGKYTFATDCISNSLDLNTMCNYYIPKTTKNSAKDDGYNINSAGLKIRLKGKYGDCYLHNGKQDEARSRGICDFKHFNEMDRVRPFRFENNYNKFTGCHNMENYNFVNDCKTILNVDSNKDVFADINGFDCMPGYARAKCINRKEPIKIPPDLRKFKDDSKSNIYFYNKN